MIRLTLVVAVLALVAGAVMERATAQTPERISVYAAGSLRAAMTEIATAYTRQTGVGVEPTYGSSGLLRSRIESGEVADVFASADTVGPQRLADEGKAGPVRVFAHNAMCLLEKSSLPAERSVADVMLDRNVRLITSTPKADPAGDYAERIFGLIDAQRPGSLARLDAKALRLVGGADAVVIPPGADTASYLLLTADRGDALLAYCSGFVGSVTAIPAELRVLPMPPALAIRADYGVTLRAGASLAAQRFVDFVLSDAGQAVFVRNGFDRR